MIAPLNHINQKRIVAAVWPDQKNAHRIPMPDGTHVDLFMGMKEWKRNGWDGNPTLGRAITDCDEIKAGDYILTQHNAFENERKEVFGMQDMLAPTERMFSIEKPLVWLAIKPTGEMYCVDNNIICKRIYKPIEITPGGIITTVTREKYDNFVYVEKVPDHITSIKTGDIIAIETQADVELKYVWGNKHTSVIRVNFERYFLGLTVEGIEYEF